MRRMPSAAAVDVEAERLGERLGDRALGGGDVERHLAAEEAVGVEAAEHAGWRR